MHVGNIKKQTKQQIRPGQIFLEVIDNIDMKENYKITNVHPHR